MNDISDNESNTIYEGNIVFVGDAGVGKTSIINRICNNTFNNNNLLTHGININEWHYLDEENNNIKIKFWDFGGQEIYYSTFYPFIQKSGIYVYVCDSRRESNIDYWLNTINTFSSQSQIIIVQNKSESRGIPIDISYIKANFNNVITFIEVSAKTNQGIDELVQLIKENLSKQPFFGIKIPKNWLDIRNKIENLSKSTNYLEIDEYVKICSEYNVDLMNSNFLCEFLSSKGDILYYKDSLILSKTIFINFQWLLNSINELFNNQYVSKNYGHITIGGINELWEKHSSSERILLIEILFLFQLGYRLQDDSIIIPIFLSYEKGIKDFDFEDSFKMEYHFQFIPIGFIARLIVRNYKYINLEDSWRHGTILNYNK